MVIYETINNNVTSGIKVALAPLATDVPIILFTFFVLTRLSQSDILLGIITLPGSALLFYLGIQNIFTKGENSRQNKISGNTFLKGILVNLFSLHPYLFWFTIGAPAISKARTISFAASLAFILGFYICLISSKVLIAILVGRAKNFLNGKIYHYLMRIIGLSLIIFSLILFLEALTILGFI
ncbi:MAG: LysE family transporter [Fibrobacteria bacterium]|nr:LysE family transporter [Fibrobacteria bacterium]